MGQKTIVNKAHSKTGSVRVTIPESIAAKVGIEAGDVLDWSLETVKGKSVIVVRKMIVG